MMKAESGFIQPFTFLGIELWIDENDRLMLSVPNSCQKKELEEVLLPIRNQSGELIANLVFKKQISARTQTLFSAEELLDPHSQIQDLPISLLPALGLFRSTLLKC
ncbi:hypothetical protein N8E87_03515 [Avibacterium paragallinarum]|uniref:hypothetical protein n=1 Tax=Avibacterium paragallinarum TaxID=728 RepID=UPI0021F6DEE7|nr:hypothetical protein [Avibacterium paragallinarum]UXN37552.1 hypothetical protein N8E87_03515 [Avibacterium paragallinarum]